MHVMTPEFNLWENLFVFWVWQFFLSLAWSFHFLLIWPSRCYAFWISSADSASQVCVKRDFRCTCYGCTNIMEYLCHKYGYGYFLRSNHNPVLSLFMTYHGACKTSNTTSSPPVFSGICVAQYLLFCVVFCRSLYVLLSFFLLAIGVFAVMS